MVVLKHLVPASLLGVVMLPTVRHLTTDFSSRQVECDRIQPRRRVLSKRSLSMKPSISSRIGFKPFARSREIELLLLGMDFEDHREHRRCLRLPELVPYQRQVRLAVGGSRARYRNPARRCYR
jgi:hypothetical protein